MNKESKDTQKGRTDMEENKPHVRRKRYSGTHPKKFEEKYKELNPEKYADTIEHVISKGITPAGMHISICVNEILDFLQIKPGQKGLDATFGYGGHTRKMLEKLEGDGHRCNSWTNRKFPCSHRIHFFCLQNRHKSVSHRLLQSKRY